MGRRPAARSGKVGRPLQPRVTDIAVTLSESLDVVSTLCRILYPMALIGDGRIVREERPLR